MQDFSIKTNHTYSVLEDTFRRINKNFKVLHTSLRLSVNVKDAVNKMQPDNCVVL